MTAVNRAKAEPDDPVRGVVNDATDFLGVPRIEDFFGTPADWLETMGIPLPRDAIPTPADTAASLVKGARGGRAPAFAMPSLPKPESFLPPPPDSMFRQGSYYQRGGYYQQDPKNRAGRRP